MLLQKVVQTWEKPFASKLTGLALINQVDARPPSPKRQIKFTQLNMYQTKKTLLFQT